jgi:hypothetical protein
MRLRITSFQRRLYLISAIILLAGLGSAAVIYLTAENDPDNALIRDYENSKRYIHSLELYGGKMNVLVDQFRRWLDSFWHGRALAFTVAGITLFSAFAVGFVAYRSPSTDSDVLDTRGIDRLD